MKDDQKEFLKNNVELTDFKEEVKKEEKLAQELDFDKIIVNKIEETGYKVINAFEQRPVKSSILTLGGLLILKEIVKWIRK